MNNQQIDSESIEELVKLADTYRLEESRQEFQQVENAYEKMRPDLENVIGKIKSSYRFYRQLIEDGNDSPSAYQTSPSNEKWAELNERNHPACSFNCHGSNRNLDYIFYSPGSMIVSKLLEMPDDEQITREGGLPSSLFPSDHIRIQAEFQVFY